MDFHQLPPVPNETLYEASLVINGLHKKGSHDASYNNSTLPYAVGGDLFSRFVDQVRAPDDPHHVQFINRMRNPSTKSLLGKKDVECINNSILTASDIASDESWKWAPIVCSGNEERRIINEYQAKSYAIKHAKSIIKWRYPIKTLEGPMTEERVEELYSKYPTLTGIFVEGAPVDLLYNIYAEKGLANGTECYMHSLSFDTDDYIDPALVAKLKSGFQRHDMVRQSICKMALYRSASTWNLSIQARWNKSHDRKKQQWYHIK